MPSAYIQTVADLLSSVTSTTRSATQYNANRFNSQLFGGGNIATLNIGVAESQSKTPGKSATDAYSIIDGGIVRLTNHTVAELLSIAESVTRVIGKLPFADALTLSDSMSKAPNRALADVISLVETFSKLRAITRLFSEINLFNSEIFLYADNYHTLLDALSISDTIARSLVRAAMTDSLQISDNSLKAFSRALAESTFSLIDSISKAAARSFLEAVSIGDSIAKATSRTVTDAVTQIDAIFRAMSRPLAEGFTVTEGLNKAVAHFTVDALSALDTISKLLSRSVTEAFATSDVLSKASFRTLTDSRSITESISKSMSRNVADAVALLDTFSRSLAFVRSFFEANLFNSENFIWQDNYRTLIDLIVVTDNISRALIRAPFVETVTISESVQKLIARTYASAVTISESIAKAISSHFVDGGAWIIDTISKLTATTKAEIVIVSESPVTRAINTGLSSLVNIGDTIVKSIGSNFLDDTLYVLDAISKNASPQFASEIFSLFDSAHEAAHVGHLFFADALSLTDSFVMWLNNFVAGEGRYFAPFIQAFWKLPQSNQFVVPVARRKRGIIQNAMTIQYATICVGETRNFYFDFTGNLTVNGVVDPIATSTWAVSSGLAALSESNTGLQTMVNLTVSGAAIGSVVNVTNTVMTVGGQVLVLQVPFTVVS